VASLEPSPWSHFSAHSVVSTAWEELARAAPKHEAWQVLHLRQHRQQNVVSFFGIFLHIASFAGIDTANLGRDLRGGGGRRSTGDRRLGKSADSEGEECSGVLHFEYGVA
jgi:hypothetical protein